MYRFIDNIGDFFTPGYYTEDFIDKVINLSGYDNDAIKEFNSRFVHLKAEYFEFKNKVKDLRLHRKYIIKETHDFNTKVMAALGYDTTPAYANWLHVEEGSVIPARSVLYQGNQARLVVLEMQAMIKANEDDVPPGLFEQQYDDSDNKIIKEQRYVYNLWKEVINKELPEGCKISPTKINDCVTAIFAMKEQRPKYIVIFAGNCIFLLEQDKWDHGAYVKFDLEELFSEAAISTFRNYYSLFYLLASKEVLAGDSQIVLMDKIDEESFKNAYEVTKDLKKGVIKAIELLANEAIYYKRTVLGEEFNENDEGFAADVKDDCLTIIYRLLFIFYAEARPEIGILPMDDKAYAKGYSLDILRDLEQTPLKSDLSRNSYFFNDSLWTLFTLICNGHKDNPIVSYSSFSVKKIDSPLFDDRLLKKLKGVKFRNIIWQDIICSLSLSEEQNRKARGRISYANLGINQLGSVYESLLAYRGFYAEEDYIEVHPVGDTVETYLVPRSRIGDFKDDEILRDSHDNVVILPKGSFVYRLNGRDRKKSASYYTPEVLTKSTVKYTLKGFVEKLDSGEMKAEDLLNLKMLEPAMGAAAFQNEVIDQLAELYLTYRQKEKGDHISPHKYQQERQKVKAYIATRNIYGVDLNPTAIELGKLSLWLNVIHKDMETPFFGHRIALGNAVIGAWFKAYDEKELFLKSGMKLLCSNWWEKAPHLLHFSKDRKKIIRKKSEIYHFLVPDKNMLGVLKITEEKKEYPEAAKSMAEKLKGWTKALSLTDIEILKRISEKIDKLISEYIIFEEKVEKMTVNNFSVYGHPTYHNSALFQFGDKQELLDGRNNPKNPYHKLLTVMNYWCSLWFWEYNDAAKLPTREEYWADIESILDVNIGTGKVKIQSSNIKDGMGDLFAPDEYVIDFDDENDENGTPTTDVAYTAQDASNLKREYSSTVQVFEGPRVSVVNKLANRYHFFHPMLEFIEVFWLRDGFDIICGNPPWLKLEFDEKDIISEKYPEVSIRKSSATEVLQMKAQLFKENPLIHEIYLRELYEVSCQGIFMNDPCNYPLLFGQQTDLYKCVLENGFYLLSSEGHMGLLHPESVYVDPSGQPLRKEMYYRLEYHFQYHNELNLFAEIHHSTVYGTHIYGGKKKVIDFLSIHNLFHPSTVDGCFTHDGHGTCPGIKEEGRWCTSAHKERIVHINDDSLKIIGNTFEDGAEWDSVKLVSIQAQGILDVLFKLSHFNTHVRDYDPLFRRPLDETNDSKAGTIRRCTCYPNINSSEMIYGGPHIGICNPISKTPKSTCKLSSDYDTINLLDKDNSILRTNYLPNIPITEWNSSVKGFKIGESYEQWIDYYKVGFREFVGSNSERTLCSAILPPKSSHINTIQSVTFRDKVLDVELCGLASSLPLDFYFKSTGASHVTPGRISSFPLGVDEKYRRLIISRVLMLNCLNDNYAPLWQSLIGYSSSQDTWSMYDERLYPNLHVSEQWNWGKCIRSYFARRMALVELDVICSLALGLSLENLELIYDIQFPVLQQNENDTWYDKLGNIIYTCSKGLSGIGLDRRIWEQIRGQISEDGMTYNGTSETYVHTIDPAKSELYGGQQVTYYAPYNKCDRIADYRRAWAHFEKVFNEEKEN